MRSCLGSSRLKSTPLAAAALAGFLMFCGAPRLHADDADCQRRIARVDHKLHEAIERHGFGARQE